MLLFSGVSFKGTSVFICFFDPVSIFYIFFVRFVKISGNTLDKICRTRYNIYNKSHATQFGGIPE